jgi:fluoride exporter
MRAYLLVFAGAGLGGMLRHAVNVGAVRITAAGLSLGTVIVNVSGSFLIGLLAGYFALRADPGQNWRLFLTTGVLGGFTTFSAYSLDVVLLYERGNLSGALLYAGGTAAACILAVLAGLWVMRQVLGG